MLHLHLIKNKFFKGIAAYAEFLLLYCILILPCLSYVNKFLPLPDGAYISLPIAGLVQAIILSLRHTSGSVEEKIAEYERTHKPFLKDILDYIIMGAIFSLLIIFVTLGAKVFDTWVLIVSLMLITLLVILGTIFYFANKAAYARLKDTEE